MDGGGSCLTNARGVFCQVPKIAFQMIFCCHTLQVLEVVKRSGDEDGNLHCIQFLELPSRELYPDYFNFIKTPISLYEIENKIKNKVRCLSVLSGLTSMHVWFYRPSRINFGSCPDFFPVIGVHED